MENMSVAVRPDEMPSRAGWYSFAGRIWPAGRSLEAPAVECRWKLWRVSPNSAL